MISHYRFTPRRLNLFCSPNGHDKMMKDVSAKRVTIFSPWRKMRAGLESLAADALGSHMTIEAKLEQARRNLLDLSTRNRLISMR
jgi:hypothetical protein